MAATDPAFIHRRSTRVVGTDRIFRIGFDVVAARAALAPLRSAIGQATIDLDVVCPDAAAVASEIVAAYCESRRDSELDDDATIDVELARRNDELTLTIDLPRSGDRVLVNGLRARLIDRLAIDANMTVIADEDEFVCSFALTA